MMAFPKTSTQNRYELTPDEYEDARRMFSDNQRGDLDPMSKKNGKRCWYNNGSIEVFQKSCPSDEFTEGRIPLSSIKKKRISNGLRKFDVNKQKVICTNTGEIFKSVSDAAKYAGCCSSMISVVCAGKRKLKSGLDFKYYGKTRKLKSKWIDNDVVNDLPFEK